MKTLTRQCPKCGKTLKYTNCYDCTRAQEKQSPCRSCAFKGRYDGENNPFYGKKHTKASIEKIKNRDKSFFNTAAYKQKVSKQCKGKGNPMYGRTYYQIWLEKYGKEKADDLQKQKNEKTKQQCKGSGNPMYGKPSPQGSGNGWKGWYKGWFFRSLKELSYVVNVLETNGDLWESAEFIKIPYINWQGTQRTYRPDFLVNGKLLVETKPTRLKSSIVVREKQKAAEKWCKAKGWDYILVDPPIITHEKIKKLHDDGLLKFTNRYEKLFQNM
jgi:hypothetical protein